MHYGEIKNCDIANGLGVRVTLFVSGCTNHCENCFQPQTWDFCYGKPFTSETEDELIRLLSPDYINGLTLLGGELAPELIILAWLVVDLLDDVFAALVRGQIGIAALSLAEQPPDGKHSAVYCDQIFHVSLLHTPQHSRRAGRLSSKNPLRRKYWQIE